VGTGFALANKRENAFARRSCLNKSEKRDDNSKKSHPVPGACAATPKIRDCAAANPESIRNGQSLQVTRNAIATRRHAGLFLDGF
jgi:hypothetical protein